jgi:putative transposase
VPAGGPDDSHLSRSVLRPGSPVAERYEFIDSCRTSDAKYAYPVKKMCQWLQVSASGFFDWRRRPDSATACRRARLAALITQAFTDSDETYGYRRIHAQLARWGVPCGPELVRGIMRELRLQPCQPRPWRASLTEQDGRAHHIPDLLGRDFTAERPGRKFVGDITYIPTWDGWLYLATVIDCHTKMVVGYAMDDNYKTPLIAAALRHAARHTTLCPDAIFHSDRGSNYTSREFAAVSAELGIRQSVGRTGICYDNAMAESFFAALKNERVHRTAYPTRAHARADIARYIEFWYNSARLHSGLGYKSPQEVVNEWTKGQQAA